MDEEIKQALKEEILYIFREQKENPELLKIARDLIAVLPLWLFFRVNWRILKDFIRGHIFLYI